MLDSDQEPSYNLSKNLLLLPRILKLMKDMVDDSTPLYICRGRGTYSTGILDDLGVINICVDFEFQLILQILKLPHFRSKNKT